jgi:hypothetical protein
MLPDKPSIAVLPFENMSGDPEQEYFADGMVEEIITALSRFKWLFVIARNSSFTFKGKAVDVGPMLTNATAFTTSACGCKPEVGYAGPPLSESGPNRISLIWIKEPAHQCNFDLGDRATSGNLPKLDALAKAQDVARNK